MQAFYINLDSHAERRQRMDLLLAQHGIAAERFPAVDGARLDPGELADYRGRENPDWPMVPGDVGCLLSHLACWRRALAGPGDHFVILEDDIHFGAGLGTFLATSDWIPPSADIVKLETNFLYTHVAKRPTVRVLGRRLHPLVGYHGGTGCYVISRQRAANLLDQSADLALPIDKWLFNPRSNRRLGLSVLQLQPALVVQDCMMTDPTGGPAFDSSIEPERAALRPPPRIPPRRHLPVRLARKLGRSIGRRVRNAFAPTIKMRVAFDPD